MDRFTAREQIAGWKLLQAMRPDLAAKPADDGAMIEAFIDACETAICLELNGERWTP